MARRCIPRIRCIALALLAGVPAAAFAVPAPAGATQARTAVAAPNSMSALGDSITRAFDACGWWRDCLAQSWATGTERSVNSHYLRITAKNPRLNGRAYNDATNGAKVADLAGQVGKAVSRRVDYVTILIGANDACTGTESAMTPAPTFEARFRTAMTTLAKGLPNAHVLVVSIPDLKRLWYVGKGNWAARSVWDLANICQSMLARPTSTSAADDARRDRVRQRVIEFNRALARVCAAQARCRFDGNAVFNYPFTLQHLSGWDYFHPNGTGQAVLARLSYDAGYRW